jgi:hypothetical protein
MTDTPPAAPAAKLGILDYIKLLIHGRPALQEAIREGKIVVTEARTAGVKTLAFWAVVMAGIASVALQAQGLIPQPWGSVAATVAAALYAVARGMLKKDDPLAGLKPFASTSEAWLGIAAAVAAALEAIGHVVKPEVAAVLASVSAGVLAIAQALAQSGAQPHEDPAMSLPPAVPPAQ